MHLYDFFCAPGLQYEPKEDAECWSKKSADDYDEQKRLSESAKHGSEQSQKITNKQKDERKNKHKQQSTSNAARTAVQNVPPKPYEKWAEFPNMNTKVYGYRLCTSIEFQLLQKEHEENMRKCCGCCPTSCCQSEPSEMTQEILENVIDGVQQTVAE